MQTIRKIMFVFTLCLTLALVGCSAEEDSKDSSSSSDSNESSSLFGNILGGGDSATVADEMRLENYTGSITLQNNSEEKAVVLGSRLVTGDNIETMTESNAYVVLDQSKVLRVNETSQVEIIQEEKHLDIHLSKGTLFFNVTTTLSEEETLEFHTNNVVTGVRGTSGIIHFDSVAQVTQIVVLTGVVTGTTVNEEQNIEAGQVAIVETLPDGTVEMTIYELEENDPIYYFSDTFIDGIQGDLNGEGQSLPLSEMVRALDFNQYLALYDPILQHYRDFLFHGVTIGKTQHDAIVWMGMNLLSTRIELADFKVGFELIDLDGNGVPEMIIYHSNYSDSEVLGKMREVYTIRDGTPDCLLVSDTMSDIAVLEGGILYGAYSSYENAMREGMEEYHRLEGDTLVLVEGMTSETAPPKIPIGELTLLTPEPFTTENSESPLEEENTEAVADSAFVMALKEALTMQNNTGIGTGLPETFFDPSALTMLNDGEIESLAKHIQSMTLANSTFAVKTRGDLLAEGYLFEGSDGQISDTAPFLLGADYIYPTISVESDQRFHITFTNFFYSATLNQDGTYTVTSNGSAG